MLTTRLDPGRGSGACVYAMGDDGGGERTVDPGELRGGVGGGGGGGSVLGWSGGERVRGRDGGRLLFGLCHGGRLSVCVRSLYVYVESGK